MLLSKLSFMETYPKMTFNIVNIEGFNTLNRIAKRTS